MAGYAFGSTIQGLKSNNGGPPGSTNIGTLPAVATAAAPSYTEGNQVALSVDLAGALRSSGGTQYDEDTAHVSGDKVTLAGVVQQAADAALSGDGDRSVLQVDDSGFLKVNIKAGSGGGVTHTDDAAFAPAVDDGVPLFGFFDDVAPDPVDEGDAGAVRMSGNRNLYIRIRDNAGNERGANVTAANELNVIATAQPGVDIGDVTVNNAAGASAVNIQDGGNSITVDGTVTANAGAGTFTTQDTSSLVDNAAFTDGTSRVIPTGFYFDDVAGTALTENDIAAPRIDSKRSVMVTVEDATTRGQKLSVLAANQAKTDLSSVAGNTTLTGNGVTGTGSQRVTIASDNTAFSVNATCSQATASNLNAEVQGDAAHDAAASGNPVLCGAQMETMADSAPGTRASTDGDANKLATSDGALYVVPTGPQTWSYHENSSNALTDASVHAAPGAGLSLYVATIVVSTGAATALNVFFEEGASTVLGPYYLEAVAGRGLVINFQTPKKITANTALTITTSAAIAHGIDVTGFIAPG